MKDAIEKLKNKGAALTPQRISIVKFIMKAKLHPTVEEIYKAVREEYPSLAMTTVYSTLELLKEFGEIQELSIRGRSASCFDNDPKPHHHLLCKKCEKIFNIEVSCPTLQRGWFDGYQIDEVQAYFYGICPECQGKDSLMKTEECLDGNRDKSQSISMREEEVGKEIKRKEDGSTPSTSLRTQHLSLASGTSTLTTGEKIDFNSLQSKKIAFICVGNACRSQMAEAFAKDMCRNSGYEFVSAGSAPLKEISPKTLEVLRTLGSEWTGKPKPIKDILGNGPIGLVVTMGCEVVCPVIPGAKLIQWEIPDPHDGDIDLYWKTFGKIRTNIMRLLKDVCNG